MVVSENKQVTEVKKTNNKQHETEVFSVWRADFQGDTRDIDTDTQHNTHEQFMNTICE